MTNDKGEKKMALVKDDLTTAMIDAVKGCPDGGANAMKYYVCDEELIMEYE